MSLKDLHSPYELYEMGSSPHGYEMGAPAAAEEDEHDRFSRIEEAFFETAQARTDNDDLSYLDEPLGGRPTVTVQAMAGRGSRCTGVFR